MTRFDYKVIIIPYAQELTEETLCELGEAGWDLVAVDFETRRYILKKPRYHDASYTSNNKDLESQGERQKL